MTVYERTHDIEIRDEFIKSAAMVSYLISMDRLLLEDEIVETFGYRTAIEKLFGKGIKHIGDLVALTPERLRKKYRLGNRRIIKIDRFVRSQGLSLGSNNSFWMRYRATVPPPFRIVAHESHGHNELH
jgi:hypothetical protein